MPTPRPSWLDLFDRRSRALAAEVFSGLPRRPTTFWYASAGTDMRPLVFTRRDHQARVTTSHGETLALPEPELFLYTCLAPGGVRFRRGQHLYGDGRTTIWCDTAHPVSVDRRVVPADWGRRAHFGFVPAERGRPDAYLLWVEIADRETGAEYRCRVLYVQMENYIGEPGARAAATRSRGRSTGCTPPVVRPFREAHRSGVGRSSCRCAICPIASRNPCSGIARSSSSTHRALAASQTASLHSSQPVTTS